ncbi:hypothetical protein BDZ91DRAFT_825291 [Kalaharituber pfeilii]|nr:hypothetical protein BDZ91DRAFT_825291 [Kalaharituber pfeilii]
MYGEWWTGKEGRREGIGRKACCTGEPVVIDGLSLLWQYDQNRVGYHTAAGQRAYYVFYVELMCKVFSVRGPMWVGKYGNYGRCVEHGKYISASFHQYDGSSQLLPENQGNGTISFSRHRRESEGYHETSNTRVAAKANKAKREEYVTAKELNAWSPLFKIQFPS